MLLGQKLLALSIWLSAVSFRTEALVNVSRRRPVNESTPSYVPHEAGSRALEDLQNFVATVQGKATANAAS